MRKKQTPSAVKRAQDIEDTYYLKRLPMWGKQVSDLMINFQWPSDEDFKEMTNKVALYLKSVEISSDRSTNVMKHITCTLSNSE